MKIKKAFTLAEIMIVLTIIGILTAILLPIANHSRPDEAVMKFKKANAILGNTIRELVNSDSYFLDGDMGIKTDGTLIDGTHTGDRAYYCRSFADVLSVKSTNCEDMENISAVGIVTGDTGDLSHGDDGSLFNIVDKVCNHGFGSDWDECDGIIQTSDNISYVLKGACEPFGEIDNTTRFCREGSTPPCRIFTRKNINGFLRTYKVICIDIDEIEKDEGAFGYALRYDGKLIAGSKAQRWMEKGFQKGSNEN